MLKQTPNLILNNQRESERIDMAKKDKNIQTVKKTYKLYHPKIWQKEIHQTIQKYGDNNAQIFVIKSKRQIGKSLALENEALRYSLNKKNKVVLIVSPTLAQCRKMMKDIIKATSNTDAVKSSNEQTFEIVLINSSKLIFRSAQQGDTIRGITADYIICDEVAYLDEDFVDILFPCGDVKKANILMASTPRFKAGCFFKYFSYGNSDEYPFIHSIDLNKYDTSEFLSAERLEFYRKRLPKVTFTQEYLGEFSDAASTIFGNFTECVKNNIEDDKLRVFGGVDWGNNDGGDDTVITIIDENGKELEQAAWNDLSLTASITRMANILKRYEGRINVVFAESNSIGRPQIELLKNAVPWCNIQERNTSNSSKAELVMKLQDSLGSGKLILKNDPQQLNQLTVYTYEYDAAKNLVTYNAPQGMHDDRVISLAYANLAYREGQRTGQYIIFAKR